jgi:hypothetical protein
MKNCKICKEDKPLSEYYKRKKGYRGYKSYCKTCTRQKSKQYYIDNPEKHKQSNPDYIKQYYQDNKEQINKYHCNIYQSIPPGIYGIYENTQLIYIGESVTPYRRIANHFSNSLETTNSCIAQAIGNGELQRKNLSFKMLEYVDDKSLRLEREKFYIEKYNPPYNTYAR